MNIKRILFFCIVFSGASCLYAAEPVIGLWGYKNEVRLCEKANELFQAFVDVKKVPILKKSIESRKNDLFTFDISFPSGDVEFIAPVSDDIWLFPKWAAKTPNVKAELKNARLVVTHAFSAGSIKVVNGRYGFGFMTKTLKRGKSSKIVVSLKRGEEVLATNEYNVEFLHPINGRRPTQKLVQIAYYPQFSSKILRVMFAENTINAGFNDLMVIHNGSPWSGMEDVAMMRNSKMRVIANFFTSGIFKKFPFNTSPPEWRETDGKGKPRRRHRDLDMQRIIDEEPVIIRYLEKYFFDLKNNYPIDGIQMDEERSPDGGYTKIGIAAFRKWAAIAPNEKLDINVIKSDYWDMWISFRSRQVAKTFDIMRKCFRKSCGNMPMGYYGAPQVVRGKNYVWARNHYVAAWKLLRGRADWGGAGYDFSMRTMRNTYESMGRGRFLPWIMVTENYNERWRKYRKISADLIRHMIASGMNGYSIWYYILDNGALYDIAGVNNFISKYENILGGELETPDLLVLQTPLRGEFSSMVYSKANTHIALLANTGKKEYRSQFQWSECLAQPATTLRSENGSETLLASGGEIVIPPRSFVSLSAKYQTEKVDPVPMSDDFSFKASFDKPSEKIFYLEKLDYVKDCEISAVVSVITGSKDFGTIEIVARDSGKKKVLGGVILSKGIVWARGIDSAPAIGKEQSTQTNYIRHGTGLKKQKISLIIAGDKVTLKLGGKKFTYKTLVSKAGKIGFIIKAKAPGQCVIEKIEVLKLKEKVKKDKSKKERGKRELKKGAPQV